MNLASFFLLLCRRGPQRRHETNGLAIESIGSIDLLQKHSGGSRGQHGGGGGGDWPDNEEWTSVEDARLDFSK